MIRPDERNRRTRSLDIPRGIDTPQPTTQFATPPERPPSSGARSPEVARTRTRELHLSSDRVFGEEQNPPVVVGRVNLSEYRETGRKCTTYFDRALVCEFATSRASARDKTDGNSAITIERAVSFPRNRSVNGIVKLLTDG